jgi:hypothetical protein
LILITNDVAEDFSGDVSVSPAKKLEDLIHLAELCVDLLQHNDEYYAEVNMAPLIILFFSGELYSNGLCVLTKPAPPVPERIVCVRNCSKNPDVTER